jgi:hypothetical protein
VILLGHLITRGFALSHGERSDRTHLSYPWAVHAGFRRGLPPSRKLRSLLPNAELLIDETPMRLGEELSEYVRRPTRTAGDLSEVADASPGITTEDLARDLEAVASNQGTPTDRDLLADLLKRVKRIEDHLGIAD